MFQVIQLTALVVFGSATHGEKYAISQDRVAIPDREVRGVLFCVQFFSGSHFTRRSLFSESGLTKLSESMEIADSITSSPVYVPRRHGETVCTEPLFTDLRACWERARLRRRTAKNTSEQWYHGGTPEVRHYQGRVYGSPMSWKKCQLFLLLLVRLDPVNFVLPLQAQKEDYSEPP